MVYCPQDSVTIVSVLYFYTYALSFNPFFRHFIDTHGMLDL
jgi:hypothetical protein